ncbi:MAG: KH domain-containing protein [Bacilli bacterium]|nr:KH domain-containing protein [Bacilli bacterium]
MVEIRKFEAKTKEEALDNAVKELNVRVEDLFFKEEFIEGKLFKSSKYIISVINKEDIKKYIVEFFKKIAKNMNLNIETEVIESENIFNVVLVSNNNAILIGKEGKTLNSLQILIRQAIKNNTGLSIKLNLDVSNYKIKKMKNIEKLVRGVAADVEASHLTISLDPMNSYERRLVHTIISEYPALITESVGEGKDRHVTIKYKEN